MAILELSMVIGAIVEMGVEAVWKKTKHHETALKLLKRFRFDLSDPPTDFDGIYVYTLVEYGVFKPEPILNFFRNEFVREAFRQSFYENDPSVLQREAEGIIQWNEETGKLGRIDYDPRREFAAFSAIFNEVVDRSRTPAEIKHDRRLDDIFDLQRRLDEIQERLEGLPLDEIRTELGALTQSYQARQFVVAPTGDKLKVFISSKMTELRDVREFVAKALDDRGIEAWVYEAHAGARPEGVVETSLHEVETADIYVGLFWQKYGKVTAQGYRHARALGKPCFVYIRDKDIQREKALEDFLRTEVYDLRRGVTYDHFNSAVKLGEQVAGDIMVWLVQRHREMTAEIQAARVSLDELSRLQAEVGRLQAASRQPLPQGTTADYLAQQMRAWFETLGYRFESHEVRAGDYFEWIINIPARRGYDRILVRGAEGEAGVTDIAALRQAVDEKKTDEGWLVAARLKSQAACDEVEKRENRDLFCYTFDELLDEDADFSGYLDWLEAEVRRQGVDRIYVPLACTKEEFDPDTKDKIGESRYDERNGWIDGYIDRWLDDPSREHISILGEFGTGKTWFALHYAWITLQRYREAKERGVERPRLPLVISLRDYAKAVSAESLFSEFFFRKHEIPLPGYSAFEQLNRMGRLLLIFDGFDEMAARVDRQKVVNNFWELAKVVVPGSKAILTCRTEHFQYAAQERAVIKAELQASTINIPLEAPKFGVLHLEMFNDEQIQEVLSRRGIDTATMDTIMGNPELIDMARRPGLIEFILEALPETQENEPLDMAHTYYHAIWRKMERDITEKRTFTSLADKLYFLCELSWEMVSTEQMSLNYKRFPERIRRYFGPKVADVEEDHWHFDLLGQTMLIRDEDGNYTPAHRSLLEFSVAYKLAAEMGALSPDFIEAACQQSDIAAGVPPQDYTWCAYFQRERDEKGKIVRIPPLHSFTREPMERLVATVGAQPLTRAILSLMVGMVDAERLCDVVEATRDRSVEQVGYTGGNAATLLGHLPFDLLMRDWKNVVLSGARFSSSCDLTAIDLTGSVLRAAHFVTVKMPRAKLGDADLSNAIFDFCDLERAEFQGADLRDTSFQDRGEVNTLVFAKTGRQLAVATSSGLYIAQDLEYDILAESMAGPKNWDKYEDDCLLGLRRAAMTRISDAQIVLLKNRRVYIWEGQTEAPKVLPWCASREPPQAYRIALSPDCKWIGAGLGDGKLHIWEHRAGQWNAWDFLDGGHEERRIRSMVWSPSGKLLASCCQGGILLIWDWDSKQVRHRIQLEGRLRSLVFSQQEDKLYGAGPRNSVSAYAVETGKEVLKVTEHEGRVYGLAGPTAGILATADNRGKIIVWQLDATSDRMEIKRRMTEGDAVLSLALDPSARLLASGSRQGNVRIWDLGSGRSTPPIPIGGKGQGALRCTDMCIAGVRNLDDSKRDFLKDRGARDDEFPKKTGC